MDEVGNEIREKRLRKELDLINSYPGLLVQHAKDMLNYHIVQLQVERSLIPDLALEVDEMLLFDIVLDDKYPFRNPKIYCRSCFNGVFLGDGRDLFNTMVTVPWNPSNTIAGLLENFGDSLRNLTQMFQISYDVGDF